VLLRVPDVECAACHVDPHAGRYAAGGAFPAPGGCGACHDARAFRPSTVDVARHSRFSFALDGAHRAAPCQACHAELKAPSTTSSTLLLAARNVTPRLFNARRSTACESCHESPHGAQFAGRKGHGSCEGCHDMNRFAPASRFDHDRDAAFALTGAHAKVACLQCHKTEVGATGVKRVVYRPLSATCESCHSAAALKRPT
jgi:hypothetical protein